MAVFKFFYYYFQMKFSYILNNKLINIQILQFYLIKIKIFITKIQNAQKILSSILTIYNSKAAFYQIFSFISINNLVNSIYIQ